MEWKRCHEAAPHVPVSILALPGGTSLVPLLLAGPSHGQVNIIIYPTPIGPVASPDDMPYRIL